MIDLVHMRASWQLLELLQQPNRPQDERCGLFESLLLLDTGFWQPEDRPRRETLKGYAMRVARKAIGTAVMNGARCGALDPEDLAQDLLLAFFRSAHRIQTNPRGWFVGVAVRMVRNELRRNGRFLHAVAVEDPSQLPAVENEVEASYPRPQAVVAWQAAENLPATYAVVLRGVLEHKTTEEIADDLGLGPATVRQRLSRGRRLLRAQLAVLAGNRPGDAGVRGQVSQPVHL